MARKRAVQPAMSPTGLRPGSYLAAPATIDEAIGVVIATLPDEDKAAIAAMAESALIGLHFGLGAWIRNNLGLWKGNRALLESTGEADADDSSMVIVEAVWRRVREMVPKGNRSRPPCFFAPAPC